MTLDCVLGHLYIMCLTYLILCIYIISAVFVRSAPHSYLFL